MSAARATDTLEWSRYGTDDQAGALNEITTATTARAARLVRQGRVFDLAHVLDASVPSFGDRTFTQRIAERAPAGGIGENRVHWIAERFEATTQMGTHMDGLNHLHVDDLAYNGNRISQITADFGTTRLGVETLPQVLTRGVLLDIAATRGVTSLELGDVITVDDVERTLSRMHLQLQAGDAVLFHTGWGRHWHDAPARYTEGEPGPGMAVAEYLADHRVAITGCDTWSFGPVPSEDPDRPFAVPQFLNVRYGVIVVENLFLDEIARSDVAEFLFIVAHPKLRGATGAWVAPLAVI
ncbi:MAG: cyclase family protein [Acidimicrobiales bacterium]